MLRNLCAAGVASPFGGYGYGTMAERHWIEVVRCKLTLGLPRPLLVAALGDFHWDPLHEIDYLEEVASTVDGLAADLVVYTGDFITDSDDRLDQLAAVLTTARATHGHFCALGNHDVWRGSLRLPYLLNKAGIRVLLNENAPMPECPGWFLTGIDTYWGGRPIPKRMDETPEGSRHILLGHEPDPFDGHADGWGSKLALQISGHTHGGQIRVPMKGALRLPSWGRKYDAGLFQKGDSFLYVNRGIGTVNVHCRFLCRPEITLFELV